MASTHESHRLCEWAGVRLESWDSQRRIQLTQTVEAWKKANRLNATPLYFSGDGNTLKASQFVGVVEVAGASIEIYPKLDAALLDQEKALTDANTSSVMSNLLWMLEAAEHRDIAETETAGLEETPDTFVDLFAFLLAKRLLRELGNGLARTYQGMEGDLRAVRGRIQLMDQVTRNWNRMDRISCSWDEFTPDTPLNRLFKCACRFLHQYATHISTRGMLSDCLAIMDDVSDVSVQVALFDTRVIRWDRATERFRMAFDLAKRLLQGTGHALGTGEADTFVFLLDMNSVFENFAHAALEKHFDIGVGKQEFLGRLFRRETGGIHQYADYYWKTQQSVWIGDAKYKHLAKGQRHSLRFDQFLEESDEGQEAPAATATGAGRLLSPSDVRQLTVYAELEQQRTQGIKPNLMLLYPFVGDGKFESDSETTWNGCTFHIVPVKVNGQRDLSQALPASLGRLSTGGPL